MLVNPICGFLGSGKTTLMRRIIDERAGREPMAVIVNEFGAVGIDGVLLAGHHVDMIEISSGCLCCTLKGSLVNALEELRDKKGVERVVIEATGVAQPEEMLEVLADPALRDTVRVGPMVTVVDVAKFTGLRRVLGGFYTAQVRRADVLLLNKIDLTTPELLARVREDIVALNPRATIVTTERCNVELSMVLDKAGSGAPEPSALEQGLASPAPAASFVSFVVPAGFNAERGKVEAFFKALPPEMVRAKGFMRIDGEPRTVQYTAGQLEITAAAHPRTLSMVFISSAEPDRAAIQAALERTEKA
jgi:G3E family GTPase